MQRVDIISPVIVGSYEPQQFLESGHRAAPGQKPGHGDRPGAQIAPAQLIFLVKEHMQKGQQNSYLHATGSWSHQCRGKGKILLDFVWFISGLY
jgi:hypothetical protein